MGEHLMWIKIVSKTFMTLFRDPKIIEVDCSNVLTIEGCTYSPTVTIYSDDRYVLADIKTVIPAFKCFYKMYHRDTGKYLDMEVEV